MYKSESLNPAEKAAKRAINQVLECVDQGRSFILEAGAGAGKTYTLILALQYLIDKKGSYLLSKNQKVACITYTNVAKEEIESRIDNNPAVFVDTIHAFCWSLIQNFQPFLRNNLLSIGKWSTRVSEENPIGNKTIRYELGHPKINEKEVLLGHDDVIELAIKLMEIPKFRLFFSQKFPFLLIDEYQDTDKNFTAILIQKFIEVSSGPLIGFFGDHWQKIYGNGCGKIINPNLVLIEKGANFRSEKKIVECLNKIRPELTQEVKDENSLGEIKIFHTNNWSGGERRSEAHWKGDLPSDQAHAELCKVRGMLQSEGWDFDPTKTKILMLTHNVLAEEQGYKQLASMFRYTESYLKKEDDLIYFFSESLEPIFNAFEKNRFGEISSILGTRPFIRTHADKISWLETMSELSKLRNSGKIGEVISSLRSMSNSWLPEKLIEKIEKLSLLENEGDVLSEKEKSDLEQLKKILDIKYSEVVALVKFIQDRTPFSTEHGVKGAEFENVLVVIGGGWNKYNFGQMLEWMSSGVPNGKQDFFERNRNLFYVVCSRPKKRLALLFTQKLSDAAIMTLSLFFKEESIISLY